MNTHPFAALIYSIEDTLGLANHYESRKTQQISRHPYDAHREYFQSTCDKNGYLPRLKRICEVMHKGCNIPPSMALNHVDILESIYTSVAHQCLFVASLSDDPVGYYIRTILEPLIAVDIRMFSEYGGESSIYYHLDCILKMEGLLKLSSGCKKQNKTVVKNYLKEYINCQFQSADLSAQFKDTVFDCSQVIIPEIIAYMDELPKKGNQTCVTLHKHIETCIDGLSKHGYKEELINKFIGIIKNIESAYTAVIILQDIEEKINDFDNFYYFYGILLSRSSENISDIFDGIYFAIGDNYRSINSFEILKCIELNVGYDWFLCTKRLNNIKNAFEFIYIQTGNGLYIKDDSDDVAMQLRSLFNEENYLSKMVSFPPQFDTPMIVSQQEQYHRYCQLAENFNVIAFNIDDVSNIAGLMKEKSDVAAINSYFSQYIPLINALEFIKNNDADAALDSIITSDRDEFPLFGFIKYALAVLQIGLMYKIQRNKIKHASMNSLVNDIINHQGMINIPVALSSHVIYPNDNECCDGWLSIDDYIKFSIIRGGNTYNSTIAEAIYSYNFTVARHTAMSKSYFDNVTSCFRVNLLKINYSSSLIIHDLLECLNDISGKVLSGLDKVRTDVAPEVFAKDLFHAKIITRKQLTDNLIHCVNGSSLGVCLLDYLTIILLFSVPGDNVDNIVALGKNTRVVELLFRAYQYHKG